MYVFNVIILFLLYLLLYHLHHLSLLLLLPLPLDPPPVWPLRVASRLPWRGTRGSPCPASSPRLNPDCIIVALVDSLLLLLPLGSPVAFSSIIGIATIGFQTFYAIPILFKLLCNQPFPSTPFDLGTNYCGLGLSL